MDCIEVEDKEDKMAAISVMEEFQKKAEETNALITNQYKELADQIR